MARKSSLLLFVLCLALSVMLVSSASAQAVYGNVFGTVTDPQGAAVPNAKVTVTSVQKGTSFTATTNEAGNYTVTHLIPGRYLVRIEATGFKTFEAKDIQVYADQAAQVDGRIQVGGTAETVTVTAEDVAQLKTDRADVSQTFTERQVEDLPVFNRNFTDFQLLTPGTAKLQWQHAASENPQGSTQIMVNGQHFAGTSFQLDGTDNRDPILGIIVINPALEAVTQAKITTQNYDAEFGQALAAVVTAQTKSGTNDIHGSAFWFRRSGAFQARNPFTNSQPNPLTGEILPDSLWNQFGGTVGGPIIKNRAFFFGSYQGTRQKEGNTLQTNVAVFPSDAARQTCFSGGDCDLSGYGVAIFDPLTGAPNGSGRSAFPGNIIPAARVSPQARALLAQLPGPNRPGLVNNFVNGGTGAFNADQFDIRVDDQTSQKLHTFGRYSTSKFEQSAVGIFGAELGGLGLGLGGGGNNPGFAGVSESRNHSIAAGFDYALSATLLTDFRFGWFRYKVNVDPNGLGTTPATDVGIPGLNLGDDFTSSMPAFLIANNAGDLGAISFGYGLSDTRLNRCNCPLRQLENQYQFVNNWTNIRGNHQFKFGADIRHANNLRVPSDQHRSGELTFSQGRTAQFDASGGQVSDTGLGLATFLLGDVTNFGRYFSQTTTAGETQERQFFYGQDTWRITPRLTFNFGLRWELYWPQNATEDGGAGFLSLDEGVVRVAGLGDIDRAMNVDMSFTNFAPRLGLAWEVRDKTVVRLGYGRSFDIGVFGSIFGHSVTQNLPVLARQNINSAGNFASVFSLAQGPQLPVIPAPSAAGTIPLGFSAPDVPVDAANNINYSIQPEKMRIPTVDAWNVTVQQEFTPTISGEIAYVGNKGTHVFAGDGPDFNCNQPVASFERGALTLNQSRPLYNSLGLNSTQRCLLNVASNNYHALQSRIEKRFSQGLQFTAHYTWQKAQNFDGDYYIHNPRLNYGPQNFNIEQVFVFSNVWDLPFGRGRTYGGDSSGVVDAIFGGWQLNTVTSIYSGLPYNVTSNACPDSGPCRANVIGDEASGVDRDTRVVSGTSQFVQWFNPAAFQSAGSNAFGNLPRNRLYGPGFWQTDASMFKSARLTERVNLQFRAEFFNVFNHVNLGLPASTLGSSNTGQISNVAAAARMRAIQFGLKLGF